LLPFGAAVCVAISLFLSSDFLVSVLHFYYRLKGL